MIRFHSKICRALLMVGLVGAFVSPGPAVSAEDGPVLLAQKTRKRRARKPRLTVFKPAGPIQIVTVQSSRKDWTPVEVEITGLRRRKVNLTMTLQCGRYRTITYLDNVRPRRGKLKATLKGIIQDERAAGKKCDVTIHAKQKVGRDWKTTSLKAPQVQVARIQTYTIRSTFSLFPLLAPKVETRSGTCSGNTLGVAGIKPVGVLPHNNDLSFQIRGTPTGSECIFRTKEVRLKKHWYIKKINYRVTRLKGKNDYCYANTAPKSGSLSIPRMDINMKCNPTGLSPTQNNNNGVRLVIRSIKLRGPRGKRWENAFW